MMMMMNWTFFRFHYFLFFLCKLLKKKLKYIYEGFLQGYSSFLESYEMESLEKKLKHISVVS